MRHATSPTRRPRYIDTRRPFEVFHWSHRLGVSEEELLKAIGTVGPAVQAVERRLRRGR